MTLSEEGRTKVRKFITQQEAADYCRVTVRTVRNWISDGFIKGYRLPAGGSVRIDLDELNEAINAVPAVKR